MSFVIGLAVIGTLGWLAILVTTAPQPERHEHMAALDRLGRRDDPGRCRSCGAELDAVGGCTGWCDPSDEGDVPW